MCIFGCESKRCRIFVMDLVNVFVDGSMMKRAMSDVVKEIFEKEEHDDLRLGSIRLDQVDQEEMKLTW
jgi:hypothetical protein